jgi:opacity protein-like surface antigen
MTTMKTRMLCLLLFCAASAFGQVSLGVKAGVPLNDAFATGTVPGISYFSEAKRYTVGPTFELHLPHRVSVEFDALYRSFDYRSLTSSVAGVVSSAWTSNSDWEFPLLLKYRFKGKPLVHPFLDAGAAFNHISGVTRLATAVASFSPTELAHSFTGGFVVGAGVDIKALVIHIQPELRYTRWGQANFQSAVSGGLSSQQNQIEFLVGINF